MHAEFEEFEDSLLSGKMDRLEEIFQEEILFSTMREVQSYTWFGRLFFPCSFAVSVECLAEALHDTAQCHSDIMLVLRPQATEVFNKHRHVIGDWH